MNKIIFYNVANKASEIFCISDIGYVPRREEHIFYKNTEYVVNGVVHNYDAEVIEVYLRRLNSNHVTYKS